MEKRIWSKPEMNEFAFAANEYVAACGDGGTNYLFTCDAGGGKSGQVWLETNGVDDCQTQGHWDSSNSEWVKADQSLGGYHACDEKHETKNQNEFLSGWYRAYGSDVFTKVLVWLGVDKNNVHCTTNLDINTWEVAKS